MGFISVSAKGAVLPKESLNPKESCPAAEDNKNEGKYIGTSLLRTPLHPNNGDL